MRKTIIALLAGMVIGAGGVLAWSRAQAAAQAERDHADALKREAEVARLRSELAGERSTAGALRRQIASAGLDAAPVKENELDIQRLLNDARPLMKSLALMFGDQRRKMTERWIRDIAEKLAEEMGLTDEQTSDMIAHFLRLDEENFAKIKSMLDRPLTILDVFTVMKDMNPQKSMDDYMMARLTDEQRKSWDNRKLETKAQQIERNANRQLERMSALNLDEGQKDRVFDILVKTNPQYDPALAVEGVTAGGTFDSSRSQDEAISEVLRPEQMDEWNRMQERRSNERKRWSDALGGFDPTQFFQEMGGGMGWGGRGRRGR